MSNVYIFNLYYMTNCSGNLCIAIYFYFYFFKEMQLIHMIHACILFIYSLFACFCG